MKNSGVAEKLRTTFFKLWADNQLDGTLLGDCRKMIVYTFQKTTVLV